MKGPEKDEGREICSLCFCMMGISQPDKRKLPNGQFAEERCINKVIFQELIRPIKNFEPNFKHPSLYNTPENILKCLTLSLLAQPVSLPWVQNFLIKILDFSQSFLGKEIVLSSLLR